MDREKRFESLLSESEKSELHHISGEINKFMVELVKKKAQQAKNEDCLLENCDECPEQKLTD